MKKLIYFLVFIQLSGLLSAQPFVDVNDTILAQIFCDRYPDAMVNNCTQIDLSKQDLISDTINLDDKLVADISPLLELSNVTWLELDGNSFDTIIGDFSKLVNLNQLDISLNRNLSKFPDFSTINSPNFEYLTLNRMGIDDQPDLSSVKNTIKFLELHYNEKTDIQDFLVLPNLEVGSLYGNRLTYYDLVPLLADTIHPTIYYLFPQKVIPLNVPDILKLDEGVAFEISVDEEFLHQDNIYYWFRDNMLISSTSEPYFKIPILSSNDDGVYHGSIHNPAFTADHDTLMLASVELFVTDNSACLALTNSKIEVETTCDDHQINLQENELGQIHYALEDITTGEMIVGDHNVFANIQDGEYQLSVSDSVGCDVIFPDNVSLFSKTDCDEVLSPNGDGIGDRYYIDEPGLIKVINQNGSLLNELQGPVLWDGTDGKGSFINAGYYLLLFENGESLNITIER